MRSRQVYLKAMAALFTTLATAGALAQPAEQPTPQPGAHRRSLELELESVPDSASYEVEVTRIISEKERGSPKIFKLESIMWNANLMPGHFQMRTRSIDKRGVPGDWTDPKEFMVKLFPPELKRPAVNTILKSEDAQTFKVPFEWSAVDKADRYKIKVEDSNHKLVYEEEVKGTSTTGKVPVAQELTWQVTAESEEGIKAEPSQISGFKIQGPKLEKPSINHIADIDTRVFSWSAVSYGESYEFHLEFRRPDGTFHEIYKKTTSNLQIAYSAPLSSGYYRMSVKATAQLRDDSDFATKEFETKSSKEEDLLRAGYELKNPNFLRVGLGPTAFQYSNNSLDFNTSTTFPAVGATAYISAGTWFSHQSRWGLMLTGETEGFPILGTNATYQFVSLLGTRKFNVFKASQIRFSFGVGEMTIPDIVADSSGNYHTRFDNTFGPTLRLSYICGLSEKWGVEASGQVFIDVSGSSPSGMDIKTNPTWQTGLGASRNLSENMRAMLDLYYRSQNISYNHPNQQTFPQMNWGINTINMSSESLIFSIELGF